MPRASAAPITSSSRRARRVVDFVSPSPTPQPIAPATRTRGIKRPATSYAENSEDDAFDDDEDEEAVDDQEGQEDGEEENDFEENSEEEDVKEDDFMGIESIPQQTIRVKLKVPRPTTSSKKSKSEKKSKKYKSENRLDELEDADMEEAIVLEEEIIEEEDDFEESFEDVQIGNSGKMTARQRAKGNKDLQDSLLVLEEGESQMSNDYKTPSSRVVVLTDQEKLERKEEAARRRRRQIEQKLQDEQDETINRLLRAQTARSRSKIDAADIEDEASSQSKPDRKLSPFMPSDEMIRWTSSLDDNGNVTIQLSVPKGKEWWIDMGHSRSEATRDTTAVAMIREEKLKAMCNAPGCNDRRKYRSVKHFEMGGCCLEHLKRVDASL
nr:hypothetical protein L203_03571 [Cryptococcus depauperatus CBS 7841]